MDAWSSADAAAGDLRHWSSPLDVAFVATSYDTAFEPVRDQVHARIEQLVDTYGVSSSLRWALWIVDDLPAVRGFGEAVRSAFTRFPALLQKGRLQVVQLERAASQPGGVKGTALLEGMRASLAAGPLDAVTYLNLNLKVNVRFSALGVREVVSHQADASVGTRAPNEGGAARGARISGVLKSRVFAALAHSLLPPLRSYPDTNAPLKVFSPNAAGELVRLARIPGVTLDCEWLVILDRLGLRVSRFPVVWEQRHGSHPPWHLALSSVVDLIRIRRHWLTEENPCSKH